MDPSPMPDDRRTITSSDVPMAVYQVIWTACLASTQILLFPSPVGTYTSIARGVARWAIVRRDAMAGPEVCCNNAQQLIAANVK